MILNYKSGNPKELEEVGRRISRLPDGFDWVISITKKEKLRTLSQNRYYWGVIVKILAIEIGDLKEDIHEALKKRFNQKVIVWPDGTNDIVGGTTTAMNEAEFNNYVNSIRSWARHDLNIHIPERSSITNQVWAEIAEKYDFMLAS